MPAQLSAFALNCTLKTPSTMKILDGQDAVGLKPHGVRAENYVGVEAVTGARTTVSRPRLKPLARDILSTGQPSAIASSFGH